MGFSDIFEAWVVGLRVRGVFRQRLKWVGVLTGYVDRQMVFKPFHCGLNLLGMEVHPRSSCAVQLEAGV